MPTRLQTTQLFSHSTPRRKVSSGILSSRDLTDDGSYDLSAYFMFNDDPTGGEDVLTSTNMSWTKEETSRVALHHQQEKQIKFEFDPDVSFDLGISPVDGKDISSINKADQETSSRLDLEKQNGAKVNRRLTKPLKVNPHNKYLERHYDADRIQKGLGMMDSVLCNNKETPKRRRGISTTERKFGEEILEEEYQLPIELAVDEGSDIAGFSLRPSPPFDSPVVENSKHRVTFVQPDQDNTALDIMDDRASRDTKRLHRNGHTLEQPVLKDLDGETHVKEDDELSINNPLAVERFISAPRLCKSTKSIPTLICVESMKENDNDFALSAQDPYKVRNTDDVSSIFRPTTAFSSASTAYAANQSFSSTEKSIQNPDDKGWNRIKQHLDQLPFVTYVPSVWPEEILSAGSSHSIGSRRSLYSPTGVNDFDDRRPWRNGNDKKGSGKSTFRASKEEELIRRLKYQIKMLLSQAHLIEDSFTGDIVQEKSSIGGVGCTKVTPVHILKSRLRHIEASYSSEEKYGARDQSDTSVEKLKVRLRRIEHDYGKGNKIQIK
jgi:hypothetical protein